MAIPDRWIYVGDSSGDDGEGGIAQVPAVHAALLPCGKAGRILYFGGSHLIEPGAWEIAVENFPDPSQSPLYQVLRQEIDYTRIFDCDSSQISNPSTPDADLFCSGHAFLPDGRLLIAGGTRHYPLDNPMSPDPVVEINALHAGHWCGSRQSWIFNIPDEIPAELVPGETVNIAGLWQQVGLLNMNVDGTGGGRWYPTLIALPNGNIFAHCGHPIFPILVFKEFEDVDDRHNNTTPEIFVGPEETWNLIERPLGVDGAYDYAPYYPRLFLVPGTGEIFCIQPLYSASVVPGQPGQDLAALETVNKLDVDPGYTVDVMDKSFFYDLEKRDVVKAFGGPQTVADIYLNHHHDSQRNTAVMLPLLYEEKYQAKILLCGGKKSLTADLSLGNDASWQETARRIPLFRIPGETSYYDLIPERYFSNLTLLPNGTVVMTGGVEKEKYTEEDGVKYAEIYYPSGFDNDDERWENSAIANETRGYHSVALLIPDGRVWTAGSQIGDGLTTNLSIEIFEPAYYNIDGRMEIVDYPREIGHGQGFHIVFFSPNPRSRIWRVALMKIGSVTHSFDGDQRYISIPFEQNGFYVQATAPPDGTVAPPGYYMLWLIDTDKNPCQLGKFVKVHPNYLEGPRIRQETEQPRHF